MQRGRDRWLRRRVLIAASVAVLAAVLLRPDADAPTSIATVGPWTFRSESFDLLETPIERWPYYRGTVIEPYGERDAAGVRVFRQDGVAHDHPVAQAQYVVNMLRGYRLTAQIRFLDAAVANAERLVTRAVEHRAAWFFPYRFDYPLHRFATLRAPWYSAMAQGIALSGFVRLHESTGEERWLDAARSTFASFLIEDAGDGPWVVANDAGHLWLEEYPAHPPDHTINGHGFAAIGLWDYWRVTSDRRARDLLNGVLTTMLSAMPDVREPGQVSRYCIGIPCQLADVRNPAYHPTHVGQMRLWHELTGEPAFAAHAADLEADAARLP